MLSILPSVYLFFYPFPFCFLFIDFYSSSTTQTFLQMQVSFLLPLTLILVQATTSFTLVYICIFLTNSLFIHYLLFLTSFIPLNYVFLLPATDNCLNFQLFYIILPSANPFFARFFFAFLSPALLS